MSGRAGPLRNAVWLAGLLAFMAAGALACNQLIGIESGHPRPVPVQIAAGGAFACARMSDGTVWCWGANDYGQLGHLTSITPDETCIVQLPDGGPTRYDCNPKPVQVKLSSPITQIALGEDFACALDNGGDVWCWGENASGQLGGAHAVDFYQQCPGQFFDGGIANTLECSPVPRQVSLPSATAIVAGTAHACAVTSSGVYCWGLNQFQQLGATTMTSGPVLAQGVTDIHALSAPLGGGNYYDYTCGVLGSGAVECWGRQPTYAMKGCPDNTPCDVPVSGATSVIAGFNFACAVGSSATLNCWGSDGFDTMVFMSAVTTPASSNYAAYLQQTNGAVAAQFDSRFTHVLAVDTDGGLWGWGESTLGQLGEVDAATMCPQAAGAKYPKCVATPVQLSVGDGSVKLIAAAEEFSLAVTSDGTVWAWGDNSEGQLGYVTEAGAPCPIGPDGGSPPCNPTPTAIMIPAP
jgi:alpha-tubulin suppressor-like RCC1 family protein